MLYQLTKPVLRPIRRRLPTMGGLDLSPIVLLLLIFLLQRIIAYYIYPHVF
jgi:YggT family protein